jgi:hypothetical protein
MPCATHTSLDVDVLCQVPDLLISDERIVICGVHNAGIVELNENGSVDDTYPPQSTPLTTISNLPNSSKTFLTQASISASLLTSHLIANALASGYFSLMRCTVFCAASRLMSARTEEQPSDAKRRDVSSPIPLEGGRESVRREFRVLLLEYIRSGTGDDSGLNDGDAFVVSSKIVSRGFSAPSKNNAPCELVEVQAC